MEETIKFEKSFKPQPRITRLPEFSVPLAGSSDETAKTKGPWPINYCTLRILPWSKAIVDEHRS